MSTNLSNTTPAAPGGNTNVTWQADGSGNTSAYVPASSGAMTLISDQLLGSPAASITFASVVGYKHLLLILVGRSSAGVTDEGVLCEVNGDTITANYENAFMGSNASTVFVGNIANSPATAQFPGTSTTANIPATAQILFGNYAGTTFFKGAKIISGYQSGGSALQCFERWWQWLSTSAITSIVLTLNSGGNFVTGSRFTLYGLN